MLHFTTFNLVTLIRSKIDTKLQLLSQNIYYVKHKETRYAIQLIDNYLQNVKTTADTFYFDTKTIKV